MASLSFAINGAMNKWQWKKAHSCTGNGIEVDLLINKSKYSLVLSDHPKIDNHIWYAVMKTDLKNKYPPVRSIYSTSILWKCYCEMSIGVCPKLKF